MFFPSSIPQLLSHRRLRSRVLGGAALTALSFTGAGPAPAQGVAGCDQFAWTVKREQALFASKDLPHVVSGATLETLPSDGVALELQPHESVPYVLPPGRQPKIANSSGGVIVISNVPKAGAYQVTASGEGWLDVIQDGRALASTAHSGRRDCPDVRKSVRFDLQPGAVAIQISGVLPAE
jgi:hypothetical protein